MQTKTKYLPFKYRYSINERTQKFKKHLEENPQKIPIIVEPQQNSKLPPFPNPRFCMGREKDIIYLKMNLREKLQKIGPEDFSHKQGIFFYVGKQLVPQLNQTIQTFYNKYKDSDGFLYVTYSQMEVF